MGRQRAFVADASHEIRTPLTLIRANAELMQHPSTTDEEKIETASMIIGETDRLNLLVTQMLTLARSDADRREADRRRQERGEERRQQKRRQ